MNMTEKNGQPSMEEILASIRRIIAEEPPVGQQPIELKPAKAGLALAESALDDHSEFELPSIFRPTPAVQEKHTPLLGRLTDAIRGAAGSGSESRAARNAEEASVGAGDQAPHRGDFSGYPTLSTLKAHAAEPSHGDGRPADGSGAEHARPGSAGPAEPKAGPAKDDQSTWKFGRAAPPPPAVEEEIKRVMAPFKDTRFRTMAPSPSPQGTAAAPMPPVPSAAPAEPVRKVDFGSIVPAYLDLTRPGADRAPDIPPPVDAFAALPAHPLAPGYSDPAHSWPPAGAEESAPYHPPVPLAPLAGSRTDGHDRGYDRRAPTSHAASMARRQHAAHGGEGSPHRGRRKREDRQEIHRSMSRASSPDRRWGAREWVRN